MRQSGSGLTARVASAAVTLPRRRSFPPSLAGASALAGELEEFWAASGRPSILPETLYREGHGKEARRRFMGHALMANRHELIVDGRASDASGTAERDEAAAMLAAVPGRHLLTVGGDKGFVTAARDRGHSARGADHVDPPLGDRRPRAIR